MSKASKIVLGILISLVIIMIIAEANKPKPLDWRGSYYREDKIPKGSFVFFEQLEEASTDLEITSQPPYEFLQDSTRAGTYFFLNNYYGYSSEEVKEVLKFAERGNTVFIASSTFGKSLRDSLEFYQKTKYSTNQLEKFPQYKLKSPQLSDKTYTFEHDEDVIYFDSLKTDKSDVLGYAKFKNDASDYTKTPNFVKFNYGEGKIFLHSDPEVFTNFFLLKKDNITYVENLLAYINLDGKIYWDEFHKAGKPRSVGLLYILMNNKYLKWTYYLLLISGVLFIIFEGKRKQKKIPIVKPLTNKTFDYTRTVAGMYLDKRAHHIIVDKQVNQLLAFIRQRFGLLTETIDKHFIKELSTKSNLPRNEVQELFQYIDQCQRKGQNVSQEELIRLNHKINDFKNQI